MKIAVCYSGLLRTWNGWYKNHTSALRHLEGKVDFHYSCWKTNRDLTDFPVNVVQFEQPKTEYNCYESGSFKNIYGDTVGKKETEQFRLYTGNLQQLAHYTLLQSLKEEYDVIIRLRYDIIMNPELDLLPLIQECFKTGKAIGIGNLQKADDLNPDMYKMVPCLVKGNEPFKVRMADFINIHKFHNIEDVFKLHEEKQLWPTNPGWYQILSKPGYGHRTYLGGVSLVRHLGVEIDE